MSFVNITKKNISFESRLEHDDRYSHIELLLEIPN